MLNGKLLFNKNRLCCKACNSSKKIASVTVSILLLIPLISFALNASATQLIVEDAWIKLAPPGVTSHAGYLRIINNSKQARTITRVSSINYEQVMLHQTQIVNDRVQMSHVKVLEVPAETSVAFTPGATHLMLMKPKKPQKINDQVSITLTFSDGVQQQFIAPVQANHDPAHANHDPVHANDE